MKLENTPTNKRIFSMLYDGQEVMRCTNWGKHVPSDYVSWNCVSEPGFYLELTSLSQISDEDLVRLYHIHSGCIAYDYTMDFKDSLTMAKHWRFMEEEMWQSNVVNYTKCAFYLISKGYYVGDGTEIEYGWVKLKGGDDD